MVAEISGLIGETVQGLPASSIAAVAMDTFASSLVCVDDHGGVDDPRPPQPSVGPRGGADDIGGVSAGVDRGS